MKNIFSAVLGIMMMACNSQPGSNNVSGNDSNSADAPKNEELVSGSAKGDCGNSLLFREGAEILGSSFNAQGKVTTKGVSKIKKVYNEGGMTISEVEMTNTDEKGENEKTVNAMYKCDGKLLYVDLSSFLTDSKQNTTIETSGLQFPLSVSVGEKLPDADYAVSMNMGGKARKISSHIRERKVEAKENLTTAAGTFECYRISSVIETDMAMPGMDEKSKKIMEEVKKKMGKNTMIFWYAPDLTIIKMELYMGDKLMTRSEITGIKK